MLLKINVMVGDGVLLKTDMMGGDGVLLKTNMMVGDGVLLKTNVMVVDGVLLNRPHGPGRVLQENRQMFYNAVTWQLHSGQAVSRA